MRYRYHHDPRDPGAGPLLTASSLRDPLRGNFTVDADKEKIEPVIAAIAARFDEYERSGSDAWAATLDVENRPAWLDRLEPSGLDRIIDGSRPAAAKVVPSPSAQSLAASSPRRSGGDADLEASI